MLDIYKQKLLEAGCFKSEYPAIIKVGMDTVSTNAPEKMKALMIATELIVFASHLRKPILWKRKTIPVNTISFIIAGSGIGKDSSMQMIRMALEPAYKKIDKYRIDHAKLKAIQDAEDDGKQPKDWRKYYSKPRDLFSGIGTLPGQMKHLAALEAGKLGAGYIQVSELGSEMQSNKDITENIIALSVGYDSGFIPAKTVKDDTQQVDPIINLPFSGLLFGSPDNIIFDEAVKASFKEEFSTKLGRRSILSFSQDKPVRLVFDSDEEAEAYEVAAEEAAFKALDSLEPWLTSLVDATTHVPLNVDPKVESLFRTYKSYNEWYSDDIPSTHIMTTLHRQHMQWKALKVAGGLAILENEETISLKHYVDAINFVEIMYVDMEAFETELSKEPYELFVSYMHQIQQNGFASMSLHQLRKAGFITGQGTDRKLIELADLANSADDSKYSVSGKYIHFFLEEGSSDSERDELA